MKHRIYSILLSSLLLWFSCGSPPNDKFVVQSEFDEQEYIWFWWVESGFLGGDPFCNTILDAMKAITPHVKVRLLYGPQRQYTASQMKDRIVHRLVENNIDTSRVEFIPGDKPYASIQDPGPVFLKNEKGDFAVADFRFSHPDTTTGSIDRNIARNLHLPTVPSAMISEGGAWQTNGRGTLLLVEAVELDRNRTMTTANRRRIQTRTGCDQHYLAERGCKRRRVGTAGQRHLCHWHRRSHRRVLPVCGCAHHFAGRSVRRRHCTKQHCPRNVASHGRK